LLTLRQEELVATSRLRDWLSHLGRDISLSRHHLSVLSPTAVQQLVNLVAGGATVVEAIDEKWDKGQTPVQSFGTWLRTETGGVPFFIEAMLQMLLEQGLLKQQPDGYFDIAAIWQQIQSEERIPLPSNVRDVILTRCQRLTQSAGALLLAGAVLGRECRFERLCQVADVAELDGLPALEELLNHRLMLEVSSEARPYRFSHDNIRQVIYTEAGEARRRLYHRRALAGLEQDKAPAAELAYHALALRLDETAFNYALLAGDDALSAHAPAEAIIHYNRAYKIGQDAQIDSNLIGQLYHNRGRALELNHQYDEALANYQEMMALADGQDDKTLKLAALTDQCIVRATQTPLYNPSEARVLGHTALALAREIGNRASEAKVLWGLLLVEMWSGGDNQRARELGQQSLTIARELGLKEQIGFTLTDMVHNYLALGEMAAASQANLETRAIWQELKNTPMLADSYATGVWVHFLAGEYGAALQAGKEGIRLSQSIGNRWGLAGALHSMGPPYLEQGDIRGAISSVEAGIRQATEAGMPTISLAALTHLIPAYLMSGSVERAAELADELYVKRDSIIPVFFLESMAMIAQVKITQGDLREAERVLNEADEKMSVDKSPNIRTGAILRADAALQLALGKPDRALKIMQDLANWAVQAGVRHQLAETFWLAGKALLALGDEAQARQSFLEGKAVAEEIGERRILWKIFWELSQMETIAGYTNKAKHHHLQAREIVTTMANQTGSDELKASFLAMSDVQSVLNVLVL
jgi:tetratricopeptide (TPR) repeat protein